MIWFHYCTEVKVKVSFGKTEPLVTVQGGALSTVAFMRVLYFVFSPPTSTGSCACNTFKFALKEATDAGWRAGVFVCVSAYVCVYPYAHEKKDSTFTFKTSWRGEMDTPRSSASPSACVCWGGMLAKVHSSPISDLMGERSSFTRAHTTTYQHFVRSALTRRPGTYRTVCIAFILFSLPEQDRRELI